MQRFRLENEIYGIDLHMHTKNGHPKYVAVEDLLKDAYKNKIKVLSFTDHNTLASYFELRERYESAEEIERKYGVKIIVGVEVNSKVGDEFNDMLVYGIEDIDRFQEWLKENTGKDISRVAQVKQLEHYKKAAKSMGMKFDEDIIITDEDPWAGRTMAKALAKYETNFEILPKEEITDLTLFFMRHCQNRQSPFYFDLTNYRPNVRDLVEIAEQSGGKVFTAHPAAYVLPKEDENQLEYEKRLEEYIDMTINLGSKGVEAYNCFNEQNRSNTEIAIKTAIRRGVYISGGTDIHTPEDEDPTGTREYPRYLGVGRLNNSPFEKIPSNIIKGWAKYWDFKREKSKEEEQTAKFEID